jgi:hypothetical protein
MGHLVVHNENHTDVRDLRCVPVHEGYGKYVVELLTTMQSVMQFIGLL